MLTRRDIIGLICQAPMVGLCSLEAGKWHSVLDYLATPTDTPSEKELQLALNEAARSGYPAFIPPNCVVVIREHSAIIPSGVTLLGAGQSSVITGQFPRKGVNCLLRNDWVNGSFDIRLANFTIDRSGEGVEHGLLLNGVDELVMEDLTFRGQAGTVSGALAISGIMNRTDNPPRRVSRDVLIDRCTFEDTGNFGVQLGFVDRVRIQHCNFVRAYREAIGIEPELCTRAANVTVRNNAVVGVGGASQGSVTGLIIITATSGGSVAGEILVYENVVEFDETEGAPPTPGIAVFADGSSANLVVRNNYISNTPGPGILLGNRYRHQGECGDRSIKISAHTSHALVIDNSIYRKSFSGRPSYSPYDILIGDGSHNTVSGNFVGNRAEPAKVMERRGSFNDIS